MSLVDYFKKSEIIFVVTLLVRYKCCGQSCIISVAANHENDTCFGNGLVMGSADCIDYAGLVV